MEQGLALARVLVEVGPFRPSACRYDLAEEPFLGPSVSFLLFFSWSLSIMFPFMIGLWLVLVASTSIDRPVAALYGFQQLINPRGGLRR